MSKTPMVRQGQRYAQRRGPFTRPSVWEVGAVQAEAASVPHARLINVEDPLQTKTISCLTLANPVYFELLSDAPGPGT